MRAVPGFQKAQALLRMEGCSYRLREVARSPFAYVDEVDPPQRQQVARCCRIQDDEACERLTELLLEAGKNRAAGGRGLDWDCLSRALGKPSADPTASTSHTLTGRAQGTGPQPLRLLPGQGALRRDVPRQPAGIARAPGAVLSVHPGFHSGESRRA